MKQAPQVDAIVIGAGFSGLYLIRKLRDELGLNVKVFERGTGVGGTWFWNRYPGARCDVESVFYSYSFDEQLQQDWVWTERYPAQEEILRYINHVADRFDLRRSIEFETTVVSCEYDEDKNLWTAETDTGDRTSAPYLISAVGCLSVPLTPEFPGLESFGGHVYHTGAWPTEGADVTGLRVGVIGTGSSGIQVIPELARQAAELTVFQRTATFTVPARNRPLTDDERTQTKSIYADIREAARYSGTGHLLDQPIGSGQEVDRTMAKIELERRWWRGGITVPATFNDTTVNLDSNEFISEFVREKIRSIVTDPEVARLLEPHDYAIGTKRIVLDAGYYDTYNRENVTLVSTRANPIEHFTPTGIVVGGVEHPLDVIVLATGYDAMTGALNRIRIQGRDGVLLREKWAAGPTTYLGVATHSFPNFFTVTGPGSPSVLSNMIASIEQHVEWIAAYVDHLRSNGIRCTEPSANAEQNWVEHVNTLANATLLPKAASWYMGANVPGKPRVFMPYLGGVGTYRRICDEVAANNYMGFVHDSAETTVLPALIRTT
ncbi:MAG: cyclohexanone monooxygenase [Subtercola sp.]|nr:cyclohexanone monooxygenase [Subtercola sp.]